MLFSMGCSACLGDRMPLLTCMISLIASFLATCLLSVSVLAAPDEDLLGKGAGYPLGTSRTWFYEERTRVGSFSHLDRILPHNTLKMSAPSKLEAATRARPITYQFQRRTLTISDFLDRQRITGLMV